MTVDRNEWKSFHDDLREELGRTQGSLADRVASSIAGRSPREMSRQVDEGRLRRMTMVAAVLFGALVTFQAWREPVPAVGPVAERDSWRNRSRETDSSIPSLVAFEEEVEGTDSDSILATLFLEGRTR